MPRRAQDLTEQKRMLRPQVINLIQWGKHHNNEIGKVLGREENDRLVIEIFQELASEGWFQLAQATMSNFETREIKPEFYELRG